jgi:hypothetical protein
MHTFIKRCLYVLPLWLAAGASQYLPAQVDPRPRTVVRVGVVLDWPKGADTDIVGVDHGEKLLELIEQEVIALTRGEFDVRFPDDKRLGGDWSMETMRAALERHLADPEVDLVLTAGVFSSDLGCKIPDLPKPVVATAVIDADLQDLPFEACTILWPPNSSRTCTTTCRMR